MPDTLEQIFKDAMDLSPCQRLALAELLLESVKTVNDLGFGIVWEIEIRDRVRAIDEERVTGVSYEDVMRAAEGRLAS